MSGDTKLMAMKAVYTYFFPEVRRLVHATDELADSVFLTSTPVEEAQRAIDALGFRQKLVVPATAGGRVDLDALHEPVIDRIVQIYEESVRGISDFENRYFTSGSSEGIFHVLAELKARGVNRIFTLAGEYEGFKEYGKTLGVETREVDLEREKINDLERGTWFISNPSARDGNILADGLVRKICDAGNEVFLDLAYVGSTRDHLFDVSHENVKGAFLSFSKPYGVFRFRIGFTFSREPFNSLYANKWFKDIQRVVTAGTIAEELGPESLHPLYAERQAQIVARLRGQYDLPLHASDALLLAHIPSDEAHMLSDRQKELLQSYRRGEGYRLCLTPYLEELERRSV